MLALKLSDIKYFMALVMFITAGCTSSDNTPSNTQKTMATYDAKTFFKNHPEYLTSKEKGDLLYEVFKYEINKPENNKKNLSQLLDTTHYQLGIIEHFNNNENIS